MLTWPGGSRRPAGRVGLQAAGLRPQVWIRKKASGLRFQFAEEVMAQSSLRWGRIVLGGFLAELLLIIAVIPVYATEAGQTVLNVVAVAGSFVVFVPVAWWLGRTIPRPVLHGVLMGAFAAAVYTLMFFGGRWFDPSAPPMPIQR